MVLGLALVQMLITVKLLLVAAVIVHLLTVQAYVVVPANRGLLLFQETVVVPQLMDHPVGAAQFIQVPVNAIAYLQA